VGEAVYLPESWVGGVSEVYQMTNPFLSFNLVVPE
jgi:hypothetical protein